MKSKKAKFICTLLIMFIVSLFCATTASASRLYIDNHIIGDNADPDKVFEYNSLIIIHCRACDAPFYDYDEYAWHTDIRNKESRCGGCGWWSLDDTRKVVRKNGETDSLGTGTHKHDAYSIQVMEPNLDQYDVYYQVNDGPMQSLSAVPTFKGYPTVYLTGLPTDITKTYLTFYYVLPGASLPDVSKPDTPTPAPKPTLKPGAADNDPFLAADALYAMGLFCGTGMDENLQPIYELDRAPTRNEAVTMLVRLLGKEDEALSGSWTTPFTDVEKWAEPYVGYAYCNGLVLGTSDTTYSGSEKISASQYITLVLRALGYKSGTDFEWDKAWELSDKIGLPGGQYSAGTTKFTRGDVATVSFNALYCKLKDSDTKLISTL